MAGNKFSRAWLLSPSFGIGLFLILYLLATRYYPGGSQADQYSAGFSWINNYWCNLLNENAINGMANTARPVALAAMGVLSISLVLFWVIFPFHAGFNKAGRKVIQVAGILSMMTGMFLFTSYHDMVVNVATAAGLIPVIGTFAGLRRLGWNKLYWGGLFILVLIALNNILYYGEGLQRYLPLVQKFTFLYFLGWICLINLEIYAIERKNV